MKRLNILLLAVCTLITANTFGQEKSTQDQLKHEFRFSIGSVTSDYYQGNYNYYYGNSYGYGYGNSYSYSYSYGNADWYKGANKTAGVFGLGYFYNFNKRIAVGATLSYNSFHRDYFDMITKEKSGHLNEYNIGFTPSVRYSWISKPSFRLYSAAGLSSYFNVKREESKTSTGNGYYQNNYTEFKGAFQLTPIGISFGKKIFGFGEVNLGGRTGAFVGGVGYRF